jgi:hypothetical protein
MTQYYLADKAQAVPPAGAGTFSAWASAVRLEKLCGNQMPETTGQTIDAGCLEAI